MTETANLTASLIAAIESDSVQVEIDETTGVPKEGYVSFAHSGREVTVYVGTGEVGYSDSGDFIHESMATENYNEIIDTASDLVRVEWADFMDRAQGDDFI